MGFDSKGNIAGVFLAATLTASSAVAAEADPSLSLDILNSPYDQARQVILDHGWQPVENPAADELMFQTRKMYHEEGYLEVDSCMPTGSAPCDFYFQKDGQYLRVATDHETPEVIGHEIKPAVPGGYNPFPTLNGGGGPLLDFMKP
jgi:hypothetical protein